MYTVREMRDLRFLADWRVGRLAGSSEMEPFADSRDATERKKKSHVAKGSR